MSDFNTRVMWAKFVNSPDGKRFLKERRDERIAREAIVRAVIDAVAACFGGNDEQ